MAVTGASAQQPGRSDGGAPDPRQQARSFTDEQFRGLVAPSRRVQVGVPIDGRLTTMDVEEGDHVEADQRLAELDDEVQRLAVRVAELQVERQRLAKEEQQVQLERIEELEENDAANEWEVRRRRVQRDAARVAHERAREETNLEQARLDQYYIDAPFDGTVVRIQSHEGTSLRRGDPVLTIVSLHPLEAQIYLPVEVYGELEEGMTYRLQAEEPVNRELRGELKMIEPLIDSASGTFRCVFTIQNEDRQVPAGFTVRLPWPQQPQRTAEAETAEAAPSTADAAADTGG